MTDPNISYGGRVNVSHEDIAFATPSVLDMDIVINDLAEQYVKESTKCANEGD